MTTDLDRVRAARRVLVLALLVNVVQAALKLGWGYWSGTLGLVADGFHSGLDMLASVVGLVGVTLAAAPPDVDHQYGHRKFEVLSAMGISLFIFGGAAEVVHEAWQRFQNPTTPPVVTWVSFAVTLASIALGFGISRYEARMAVVLGSSALAADASHSFSDMASSLAVLVGLVLTRFVHPQADTAIALVVGALIVRVGYRIALQAAGVMSDRAVLDPAKVERVAREVPGIVGAARIRSRGETTHAFLDLVAFVDPTLSVAAAHELVDRVEERLRAAHPGLVDIVIHVEPAPPS